MNLDHAVIRNIHHPAYVALALPYVRDFELVFNMALFHNAQMTLLMLCRYGHPTPDMLRRMRRDVPWTWRSG